MGNERSGGRAGMGMEATATADAVTVEVRLTDDPDRHPPVATIDGSELYPRRGRRAGG